MVSMCPSKLFYMGLTRVLQIPGTRKRFLDALHLSELSLQQRSSWYVMA